MEKNKLVAIIKFCKHSCRCHDYTLEYLQSTPNVSTVAPPRTPAMPYLTYLTQLMFVRIPLVAALFFCPFEYKAKYLQEMEEFHKRYSRTCRERHVFPLEGVLNHIRSYSDDELICEGKSSTESATKLDLSCCNLTPEDCNALVSALTDDLFFEELNFSDCLLSEESSKIILRGLMDNKAVKRLNLKGNNIRSGAAEILGQFLMRNGCVRSLLIEWNSLGLWDNGMRAICEGLAHNQALLFLDLRNNQITHEGASQIAIALKRNQCLRGLDLRWNNVGLLGGREFLEALKFNKRLVGLELTGNNIPQDIVQALSVAVQQNSDRQVTFEEHQAQTEALARELEMTQEQKRQEVLSLKEEIDKQKSSQEQLNRSMQIKVDHLRTALDERKAAFDSLSSKLSTTESELLLSRKMFTEQKLSIKMVTEELEKEKESKAATELLYRKKMNEILEKNQELENTINILERRNKSYENKICTLEKDIETMETQFEDKGKASDKKFQEELLNTERRLQKEVSNLQQKALEYRETIKEKIMKLEDEKNAFEEEVSGLKSQLVLLRISSDEELRNTKARLKQDEIIRSRQYDEHISQIQHSQSELQIQNTKQLTQITDLQSQLNSAHRDNDMFRRQIETLKQQVEQKDADYRTEVNRLRIELDSERKTQSELQDKISDLESRIVEMTRRHRDAVGIKESELEDLKEQLRSKDNEIKRIHDEEMKRAELLEKAIYSYVSSTKNSSLSPHRS